MVGKKKTAIKKVLIIDDEGDLRRLSSWVLEAEGYTAFQAPDAETGIKIIRDEHPDLVLLDIRLPGRSGWSVLEEVKNAPQLCDIPLVILTASADAGLKEKAKEKGATDFIVKPIDVATLRDCVNKYTRQD